MDEKKVSEKKNKRGGKRQGAGRKAPDGRKTKHLNVVVTPEFWQKLQDFAQNEKLTVSDFLRSLVLDYERRKTAAEE